MSAIEAYYAMMPMPTEPYYAGDDEEDDDGPMTAQEEAIMLAQIYRDF
jgi:hypothetical protein